MSRFDYVRYDDEAQKKQTELKLAAQKVEAAMKALDEEQAGMFELIGTHLAGVVRPHDLAIEALQEACLTESCYDKLEVAYAWCGKGIRDEQIERNGGAELEEGRGNE